MRLPRARLVAASTVALAMGAGTPAVLASSASASSASAASSPGSAATAVAKPATAIAAPVTGAFKNQAGTGTFTGTFTPTAFKVVNGALVATGVLKGTLKSANGTSLGTVSQTATAPVNTSATNAADAAAASCSILNLVLGPLHLNLLGLVVDLNQIHLPITAVPGSLLGDLLCSVDHLLNSGGALSGISALLNSILGNL